MSLWDILASREKMKIVNTAAVAKPVVAKTFDGMSLSISCTTPGAVLYYTVDGNDPEPPIGQSREDQENRPIVRASSNGSPQKNGVGSSTFRFDRFGPNNNLRIPSLLLGEANALHVRCVATLEDMENSEVVDHMERPRLDDPNDSFSPAFESFSEPASPQGPSAPNVLSPGGTAYDSFASPAAKSSRPAGGDFDHPASEDEADPETLVAPPRTPLAAPSTPTTAGSVGAPNFQTGFDMESSDL